MTPISAVVRPMPNTVITRTSLRPWRSPIGPKTTAPRGLAMNPTAKTANEDNTSVAGSPAGKNCAPITATK
jgi:hypothetical protein